MWNELLGRLAAFGLFYSLGRSQRAGNFDHGFWLIQKLDHSTNLPKNPVILWSNLFVFGVYCHDHLLKLHLFSTISLDDFKNLWQIFEKLFFSMNDYDVVSGLLDDINAYDDGNLHIISINYH